MQMQIITISRLKDRPLGIRKELNYWTPYQGSCGLVSSICTSRAANLVSSAGGSSNDGDDGGGLAADDGCATTKDKRRYYPYCVCSKCFTNSVHQSKAK